MSDARDKSEFKATLTDLLTAFDVRQDAGAIDLYAGVPDPNPLEHTTRGLLLDGIIQALGWKLAGGYEVVGEARVQADTTLFIDYLGVDPDRRIPLLIVEAKAWRKPFLKPRDGRVKAKPNELIRRAIDHIRAGGDADQSPVIKDWHDWLKQVRDYVQGLRDQHGHHVQRVVITSGQWMLIFTTPVSTFCSNEPLDDSNLMILLKDQFVEKSDDIFDLIGRKQLNKSVPSPIRTTQLLTYLRPADLIGIFHSLLVKYEESGLSLQILPQIHVYPSITLLRSDGQLITVHGGLDRFTVPITDVEADLTDHLQRVDAAARVLLLTVSTELGVPLTLSSLGEFPGFPLRPRHPTVSMLGNDELGETETIYLDLNPYVPNEGLMAIGTATHFLLDQPTVSCRFHDWHICQAAGSAATANAITVRSTALRSYFKSRERHYCAHQGMYDRREQQCKIDAIDRYLCCKACAFQYICWPTGGTILLPCGTQ